METRTTREKKAKLLYNKDDFGGVINSELEEKFEVIRFSQDVRDDIGLDGEVQVVKFTRTVNDNLYFNSSVIGTVKLSQILRRVTPSTVQIQAEASGEEHIKLKLSKKLASVLQVMAKEVLQMGSEESSEEGQQIGSQDSALGKRTAPSKTKKQKIEKSPRTPRVPRVINSTAAQRIPRTSKAEVLYKKGKFNKTVEILTVDSALEDPTDLIPEDLSDHAYNQILIRAAYTKNYQFLEKLLDNNRKESEITRGIISENLQWGPDCHRSLVSEIVKQKNFT